MRFYNNNNEVFLHIDSKTSSKEYYVELADNDRVHFMHQHNITWGGIEAVKTTLEIYGKMLDYNIDRFVLLQGLEYPLYSNKYISDFFECNKDKEFIKGIKISGSNIFSEIHKVTYKWNLDNKSIFNRLILVLNKVLLKLKIRIPFKKDTCIINGNEVPIYRGWAQIALTRETVEYILETVDKNPKLINQFSNFYAPDELFFHTIIFNSPFAYKAEEVFEIKSIIKDLMNLSYFEYKNQIKIFTSKSEYSTLANSGCLYARKVTSRDSKELLDYIDSLQL